MLHRDELNAIKSKRVGEEPENEAIHFYVCASCGQAVDKRRLGDVFHHEQQDHEPIDAGS